MKHVFHTLSTALLLCACFAIPAQADETDTSPIKRVPPVMPSMATHSGHCNMKFDVNKTGTPFNIRTFSCTEDIFAKPSKEAVRKWVYAPARKNGKARERYDVETRMSYKLSNQDGTPVSEAEPVKVHADERNTDTSPTKVTWIWPSRVPPLTKNETSIQCCVSYSISQIGRAFNIHTENCRNKLLAKSTIELVSFWKFKPAMQDGIAVSSEGHTRLISYTKRPLSKFKEPNGYTPIIGSSREYDRVCRLIS
ncbi:MAG: hypothetical protein COA43_08735 [Robiginitomaculum sp.]|nr:MAG: hypothetical protein COA43_08735 [Robiginitomaculum sp.]